ncbi:MAG: radical SAM protein [Myxococcota bacterium]|nr:radical SAM protein [Myxococcota bacterium]
MIDRSRRDFARACLCLSLGGWVPPVLAGPGCRRAPPSVGTPPDGRPRGEDGAGVATAGEAFEPGYLPLHRSGELARRGEALWEVMRACELCPRRCGVNRLEGARGFCHASSQLEVASYHPHFGEEEPLVGRGGSGTIFLSNCNLRCVFCINWEISQGDGGEPRTIEKMAGMMLALQEGGCLNINVVTPTHYAPHIVLALDVAAAKGLRVPVVYNTCGWERLEIIEKLDGVVDIYLPDHKYADGEMASRYSSGASTYPEVTQAALLEMNRQVGVAKPADDGIMYRGLMIRHLVMPNNVGGSVKVVRWIAEHLPRDTYVNIMSQYQPVFRASEYPEIARRITREEYDVVVRAARDAGLTNLDIQGYPG